MALLTMSDVSQEKLLLHAIRQLDPMIPSLMAPRHPLLRRPKQVCVVFAYTRSEFHTPTGIPQLLPSLVLCGLCHPIFPSKSVSVTAAFL